jgi:hypothetical protein
MHGLVPQEAIWDDNHLVQLAGMLTHDDGAWLQTTDPVGLASGERVELSTKVRVQSPEELLLPMIGDAPRQEVGSERWRRLAAEDFPPECT